LPGRAGDGTLEGLERVPQVLENQHPPATGDVLTSADQSIPATRPVLVVVEDDAAARSPFWGELSSAYEVVFTTATDLEERLREREVALIIIDDSGGHVEQDFALRDRLVAAGMTAPMALMAASGDESEAVEALRRGFVDFLVKRDSSFKTDLVKRRIETNLELARLKRENERLHRAIEESQARLFNVYDSLDDVIMQIDHDCRVVSLNRSAAALANIEPKDGVGRACWQLFDFHPCEQRTKREGCHIYRTFLEGETIRGERRDEKSKSITQYMTFITTLKGEDYTVYRETDVTEKRRLEEKIASALRSLGASPDGRDE
jgi:FixJ family two-component response regulator